MKFSLKVVLVSAILTVPAQLEAQEGPSPTVATAISGGTLLVGAGLIPVAAQFDVPTGAVLGVTAGVLTLFGPSLGFVYAGRSMRGVKSSLFRVGCIGLMLGGAGLSWDEDNSLGAILAVTGLAAGVGSTFYDVFTVGDAAREERAVLMEATVSPRGLGLSVRLAI